MNKLLLIVTLFCISLTGRAQSNVFKNGDQVCFIGNSITMQGGFHHNIALFYATRYPKSKVRIFNCGISGNHAANVIARLDSDILVHHPNWSVIMLGMNDVRRDFYSKDSVNVPDIEKKKQWALDLYRKNYEIIIQTLLKNGSKIILQTPSIYEESPALAAEVFPGRNNALKICAGYIREFGKKYNLPVVDYWYAMQRVNRQIQATDASATIVGKDREHPGNVGHLIMSYQFLRTTQPKPMVSSINIGHGKSVNCIVSQLKRQARKVSFTVLENSLPFPTTTEQQAALKLIAFTDSLNKEVLNVSALSPGKYRLKIDGYDVGSYSESELKGLNLALLSNTPQYLQAKKVLALFQESWKLEADYRWMRAYAIGRLNARKIYSVPDAEIYFAGQLQKLTDTTSVAYKNLIGERDKYLPVAKNERQMLARMDQLHDMIYHENQPVPHYFELIKLN